VRAKRVIIVEAVACEREDLRCVCRKGAYEVVEKRDKT
jgi:hypothetical protein